MPPQPPAQKDLNRRDTPERREYWDFVERTALRVRANPEYHLGCPTGVRATKVCLHGEPGEVCSTVMLKAQNEMEKRYGPECKVTVTHWR